VKVLLLGGTGFFGKRTADLLARESLITEIGLASRNLENPQSAASEVGYKAHAVGVDIKDLPRLSAIAGGYDIIINAVGPTSDVQVPAIQAAIEAGADDCDLAAIGKYAKSALQLNHEAQTRGITAVIATGWVAMNRLMAVHACHMLDETEQMSVCWLFDYTPGDYFSPEQSLARARELGRVCLPTRSIAFGDLESTPQAYVIVGALYLPYEKIK
jgi:saccharopine dehydrogenase-like NADP-dependent oxidoreductase